MALRCAMRAIYAVIQQRVPYEVFRSADYGAFQRFSSSNAAANAIFSRCRRFAADLPPVHAADFSLPLLAVGRQGLIRFSRLPLLRHAARSSRYSSATRDKIMRVSPRHAAAAPYATRHGDALASSRRDAYAAARRLVRAAAR